MIRVSFNREAANSPSSMQQIGFKVGWCVLFFRMDESYWTWASCEGRDYARRYGAGR